MTFHLWPVALNYGVFRRADFNATPVNYMFFDMGASATTATIVSYAVVNQKNPITGYLETYPQVSVTGFGFVLVVMKSFFTAAAAHITTANSVFL